MNRHLDGAVRSVGARQGYLGISVLYGSCVLCLDGRDITAPTVVTAWEPTPDELAALSAGASVMLELLAQAQPPMRIWVGTPPEPLP